MEPYNVQNDVTDKYSLRGRVFNKLREDILEGKYQRNEPLKEVQISKELGVSRTPVREAMRQLELEGLVHVIPNKGVVVSGIDSKDIKDIYAIRSLIEGLAAKWAAQLISHEQLDRLEEIVYLSEFHFSKNHTEKLYELDNSFHEMIYEASNSKILQHVLSDFHHYVQRIRRASISVNERAEKSIKEHKAIVEAIKAGDAEQAERLTNEHVKSTVSNVMLNNLI